MSVSIPTYLEMAPCGMHGHFVSPGGVKSLEFPSKEDALEVLRHLRANGVVDDMEAKFLEAAVRSEKDLAPTLEEARLSTIVTCAVMNCPEDDEDDEPLAPSTVH